MANMDRRTFKPPISLSVGIRLVIVLVLAAAALSPVSSDAADNESAERLARFKERRKLRLLPDTEELPEARVYGLEEVERGQP